ncbi:hypothetical protein Pcinc_026899 [Petrolisthes cinctipes]|uniref:Deacetylase sirtuin-type domain-containing protein n=1 Tax=Petrolisthes cinctipes TaxID=88211 RepID=A0AAE1KBL7_PETCI|nr:hypothetical protein Pcinc_026899 [Petrolisthes cinctipes]
MTSALGQMLLTTLHRNNVQTCHRARIPIHRHITTGRRADGESNTRVSRIGGRGGGGGSAVENSIVRRPYGVSRFSHIGSAVENSIVRRPYSTVENSIVRRPYGVSRFGRRGGGSAVENSIVRRPYGVWSSSSGTGKTTPVLKNVEDLAEFIKERVCNVLVMVGAGISTPSGIPDFRSPGTGLYHNLQKYNLPYPEAIFDIDYFMMDPSPFFTLAQDLYPGVNYTPNTTHHFLHLLHLEHKLQMLYTQNIDGLERLAGVPEDKLMEAHGTFARASCTLCGRKHGADLVKQAILEGDVPIICDAFKCKGKVKPDIVFFGENLPSEFWDYHEYLAFTDLLLVMGTSLEVYPFAGVAEAVSKQTPRVLINKSPAGTIGSRPGDLHLTGDIVHNINTLVNALGWTHKLRHMEKHYIKTRDCEE